MTDASGIGFPPPLTTILRLARAGSPGQEVRDWLQTANPERLEIIGDALALPWSVLYDQPPNQGGFGGDEVWQPFWGRRYNLIGGRRVQWLRGRELPAQPNVALALDPGWRGQLPAEEQKRLADFIDGHALAVAESRQALTDIFQSKEVDLLYVCGRAEGGGVRLGNDVLSASALDGVVTAQRDGEAASGQTLVILNPSSDGDGGAAGGNLLSAFERFSGVGLIGAWQPVAAATANRCGLDLLQALAYDGQTVSQALAALRQRLPVAGLVYFASCPPDVRTAPGGTEVSAGALPPPLPALAEPVPLPDEPYQPLMPLDETTAPLLVGREFDIAQAAGVFDDGATRLLLVHGLPGVGKSSLLRAGVVPYLEERCVGYRVLRSRGEGEDAEPTAELDYPILPIRATSDLAGQLALAPAAHPDLPRARPARSRHSPRRRYAPPVLGHARSLPRAGLERLGAGPRLRRG